MTIQQLSGVAEHHADASLPVICITAKEYPLLFCSQFFTYNNAVSRSNRIVAVELSTVQAQLSSSFLGTNSRYWLGSIDGMKSSALKEWRSYLERYAGPHQLIFFTATVSARISSSWTVIRLPEKIDYPFLAWIASWYQPLSAGVERTLKQMYAMHDAMSLDQAVLLAQYAVMMGNRTDIFFHSWLARLVQPTSSLFTLAQCLLTKHSKKFFTHLAPVCTQYVPQFWLSFWSEQLWRASAYVRFMHEGNYQEAKRIGHRLPFSFLNRDWKKSSQQELRNAHHFLYRVDCQLKHGVDPAVLDLFYSRFLTGGFSG